MKQKLGLERPDRTDVHRHGGVLARVGLVFVTEIVLVNATVQPVREVVSANHSTQDWRHFVKRELSDDRRQYDQVL